MTGKIQRKNKRTSSIRKTNTFDTLFSDLLKTLQLVDGKELTPFQSQLYKNTLNAVLEARIIKENPLKPSYSRYETLDTTPTNSLDEKKEKEIDRATGIKKGYNPNENPGFAATELEEENNPQEHPPE